LKNWIEQIMKVVSGTPTSTRTLAVCGLILYSWILLALGGWLFHRKTEYSCREGDPTRGPAQWEELFGPIDAVYTWVNGSDPQLIASMQRWKEALGVRVEDANITEISTKNRFRDNDELRYSLRSLMMYAPWIRHIFIVTNGQVPDWLDTSNPRVSVVPHSAIFPNRSHLPTFSSPAIESNLFRIPGLSRRWLYFNDDVFLMQRVYPTDWMTSPAPGRLAYKTFLAWPVPPCAQGCVDEWIGDQTCDLACNVSECRFDGGDCEGVDPMSLGSRFAPRRGCSQTCISSFGGDGVCDAVCNKRACAFDVGDCGLENLRMFDVNGTMTEGEDGVMFAVSVPPGLRAAAFNLSQVLPAAVADVRRSPNGIVSAASRPQDIPSVLVVLFSSARNGTAEFYFLNGTAGLPDDEEGEEGASSGGVVGILEDELPEAPSGLTFRLVVSKLFTGDDVSEMDDELFDEGEGFGNGGLMDDYFDDRFDDRFDVEGPFMERDDDLHYSDSWGDDEARRRSARRLSSAGARGLQGAGSRRRLLMDTFGGSLRHVNRLMDSEFGHQERYVIAHMPHMIDTEIFWAARRKWWTQWEATSSNRFRSASDMQFSFAYFNFMIEAAEEPDPMEVLESADVDGDGRLSFEELRLLARLTNRQAGALSMEESESLANQILESVAAASVWPMRHQAPLRFQQVIDSAPWVFETDGDVQALGPRRRYRTERADASVSKFLMIQNNLSTTVHELEEALAKRRKYFFLCINDNMDDEAADIGPAQAEVARFLRRLFPEPSPLERGGNGPRPTAGEGAPDTEPWPAHLAAFAAANLALMVLLAAAVRSGVVRQRRLLAGRRQALNVHSL